MRQSIRTIRALLWVARIVFRFLSGRPMSGERKTDATFLRPATRSLDPSHTALRWEMMRGASRAAWRLSVSYLLLLCLLLPLLWVTEKVVSLPWYVSFSFLLWSHLLLLVGGGISYAGRKGMREYGYVLPVLEVEETEEGERRRLAWRRIEGRREWRMEKVLPVSRSAAMILGVHIPERKADRWVTVPKGYRDGESVEILLPASFTGADEGVKKRLVSSVSSKLGVSGLSARWETEGSSPRVLLSVPPSPPKLVEYGDVEEYLLSSEEYRPFLGLSGKGDAFLAEMVDDSPHIGLSAGSGAGKSTLAKLVMMQALRWGWTVVVLDWKETDAYAWLGGLAGVRYVTTVEAIHDMGVQIAEEISIRKGGRAIGRPKILFVCDEWNVTADLLKAYWDDLRSTAEPEDKKYMPLKSPGLRGYAQLPFAGRELGMFDFRIAQRFSARVFNGNGDIRENYMIKLLARYTPQTQKMLAPDIKPFPKKDNTQGRWVAVIGDTATVFQAPLITNEQARAYASGGVENPVSPFASSSPSSPEQMYGGQGNPLRRVATPSDHASADVHSSVSGQKLSEIASVLDHLGITHGILKKAARSDEQGDKTFPAPISGDQHKGYRYDPKAVLEWARKRHAEKEAEKVGK